MTIIVGNTSNTNTFDYWRNRTNELADAMTNYVVTTDSNTAVGNAAVSNKFTANIVSANVFNLANSTVNTDIGVPTSTQISNGQFFLNANGSWVFNTSAPVSNGTTNTASLSQQVVDSYPLISINAAEYYIHVKDNNSNSYQSSKILTIHDTGNAYSTEYATISTNGSLGVFAVDSNLSHVRLLFTPVSSNTKVTFTRVEF